MIVTVVTGDYGNFIEGVFRGTPDEVMAKHFPQGEFDPVHPGVYWERDDVEGVYRWHVSCHKV